MQKNIEALKVPINVEIVKFNDREAKHFFYAGGCLFVSNYDNDISCYKLDQKEILAKIPSTATSNIRNNVCKIDVLKIKKKSEKEVSRI